MILRLLFLFAALSIVLSGVMYLISKDTRYLKLAWQIARFVLVAILIFVLLFILERYVLIGWFAFI